MSESKNQTVDLYDLCKNCRKISLSSIDNDSGNSSDEKCAKWLRTASFSDGESVCSKETSEFSEDCECYSEEFTSGNKEVRLYGDADNEHHDLIFRTTQNTYKNVTITKSKNVHLGNITYVNGPIYVNQTANIVNNQTTINQYVTNNINDVTLPRIVKRISWLAQPPLDEYTALKQPAKYVIITHSATDQASTEPENVLLVRLIQQFHVESRKWEDIGYNFLVGADGNIYEGRGWNVEGAHTYCYNKISVGICFIGYYSKKLPPQMSLDKAKSLIECGVKIGAIDQNYRLLGHCQCSTTESPGAELFEEIKTWKNWYGGVDVENPAEELAEGYWKREAN